MVTPSDICNDCAAEGELSAWCQYCGQALCDECARPAGFPICLECEETEAEEE
jgi:hypothetical protein